MPETHPYFKIYQAISNSEYGQILRGNIRFSRFKPETIKNSTWEKLLGPDVNNLRHMWFTKKLTDAFIANSPKKQFNSHEAHLLRLAATIHDLAESIVGDIQKIDKNTSDEQRERIVFIQIIQRMTKSTEIINRYKSDIYYLIDHILFPKSPTRLSTAFSAIEYLGYLHTAVRAKTVSNLRTRSTPLSRQLQLLNQEVTINSLEKLSTFSPKHPAVSKLIRQILPRLNHHAANTVVIGTANTKPILPVNVRTISSATIS